MLVLKKKCGTLIRISDLHIESLPNASEIIDGLKRKVRKKAVGTTPHESS